MIKNIIREYLIKVRYNLSWNIICFILCGLSAAGRKNRMVNHFFFLFLFYGMYVSQIEYEHINFLIPVSDCYRMQSGVAKNDYESAYLYYCYGSRRQLTTFFLFHRPLYGDGIFVVLLFITYFSLTFINVGISGVRASLAGNRKSPKSAKIYESLNLIIKSVGVIVAAELSGQLFSGSRMFSLNYLSYMTSVDGMIVSIVVIVITGLDIVYNYKKRLVIGDYNAD